LRLPRPLSASATPLPVLAAAFLFNLGQGALRPSLPLYLHAAFAANYRLVTAVPAVFGTGKWLASVPTGYLLGRLGHRLAAGGLLLIAGCDVGSALTSSAWTFLALRGAAGVGWAMFATVATTTVVAGPSAGRRGRAVSALLAAETLGLLVGSAGGGWLYQHLGGTSPFVFEASCMLVAAAAVWRWAARAQRLPYPPASGARRLLGAMLRTPAVTAMGFASAVLIAVQAGALVFLFPLYLASRGRVEAEAVGLIVSLAVLGRLAALAWGGAFSDRRGRMPVLVPGLLAYAVLLAILPLLTWPGALGAWSLAIGAVGGLVAPLPAAIVGDATPPGLHGIAVGTLRTMTDTGHIAGPIVLGALADALGLPAAFLSGALLLVFAAWQSPRATRVAVSAGGHR
jgi:MFS family permease